MTEKMKTYGVIAILYLVIIGGILLLNERYRLLNQKNNDFSIGMVSK